MSSKKKLNKLVLSALFLSLCMVLPLLTGQIRELGNALCPMHLPVLLCGFICGPWYGLFVGLIAPLLRFMIFGMPPLMPVGIPMSLELATYGFVSGILYRHLPKRRISIYVSLITAMVSGRLVWGITRVILLELGKYEFSWEAFVTGAFLTAVPGIILQLILVPAVVTVYEKYKKAEWN